MLDLSFADRGARARHRRDCSVAQDRAARCGGDRADRDSAQASAAAAVRTAASRTVPACCRCCRATPSPSTASICRPASSPIPRPRARLPLFDQSRRALGADFLHGLCREIDESRSAAGDLRVQRRTRRRFGFSQSRPGRAAHRPVRPDGHDGAKVRLIDNPDTWLAVHRSRADRSGRHRLEPRGQAGRRQRLLGRAQRRASRWPR